MRAAAIAIALAVLAAAHASAVQLPGIKALSDGVAAAANLPQPANLQLFDRPGDDGSALLLTFTLDTTEPLYILPQVESGGDWAPTAKSPLALDTIPKVSDMPEIFGHWPDNPDDRVIVIDSFTPAESAAAPATEATAEGAEAAAEGDPAAAEGEGASSRPLEPGTEYHVQLTLTNAAAAANVDAGNATPHEEQFVPAKLNVLLVSLLFCAIILTATTLARSNPGKLFIRRIAGLEAVEEAIGRATEMGKPVMQINGLDPLTTPSTLAAVNILGQIARKVAHYDSRLMVPSFDPVVLTVSQETVKQAYLEEGRPDAYREEDIFFVTDQQFSFVASVCGLMLREKPAANFFLGYFYAESLLLAETGQSTGAIQIAGTDAQAQLPFFITTCDYTLIGEELYAASAYLSREPILLGSLKGLDLSKVIIMLLILFGTILATAKISLLSDLISPLG